MNASVEKNGTSKGENAYMCGHLVYDQGTVSVHWGKNVLFNK